MMIPTPPAPRSRAHSFAAHLTALLGLLALSVLPSAHAAFPGPLPPTVDPADTYSIALIGYNFDAPSGDVGLILPGLNPTFGLTQTYPDDALGGQTLTVTSSESITSGTTFDTITISVPTNFVPSGLADRNGAIINAIEFSIGTYNGGTETLDYTKAITGAMFNGSATYTGPTTVSFAGFQNPLLTNADTSLSNEEALKSNLATTPISLYGVTSFTFTIAVPEPSTVALTILGAAGLCWIALRRRAMRA